MRNSRIRIGLCAAFAAAVLDCGTADTNTGDGGSLSSGGGGASSGAPGASSSAGGAGSGGGANDDGSIEETDGGNPAAMGTRAGDGGSCDPGSTKTTWASGCATSAPPAAQCVSGNW